MHIHQINKYRTRSNTRRETGFTLIELVIVIVILGVLAAAALPRFFDLTSDARKAAVAGVAGAFTTGIVGEHSKWTIDGSPPGTLSAGPCAVTIGSTSSTSTCDLGYAVAIDGNSVGFNSFGYPTTSGATGVAAVPTLVPPTGLMALTDAVCNDVWTAVLASNRPTTTTETLASAASYTGGSDWSTKAAGDNTTCTFTYYGGANKATTRKIVYYLQTGQIILTNV